MTASWIAILVSIVVMTQAVMTHGDRTTFVDELGGDVTLDCKEDGSAVTDFEYWVLPTNTTCDINFKNYYIEVRNGGAQLYLHEVSVANIGEYKCVTNSTTYDRIFFDLSHPSLTEYYKNNIIVGVCVTLGVALVLAGIFLTYHFRWRDDKSDHSYSMEDPNLPRSRVEYVNKSYNSEPVALTSTVTESKM